MNRAKFAGSSLALGGLIFLVGVILLAIKYIMVIAWAAEYFVLIGLVLLVIGLLVRKR